MAIGVFPENPAIDNASVGLPELSANPRDAGLSFITVAGYSPLGHEYNNPQESASDTFQLVDTLTWTRGAHLVKAGGEWYGVRQEAFRDVQARGFLAFSQQGYTGNALADLLLGLPVLTGGARLDNPQHLRAQTWSLFVHDDWRARPTLTLTAGVRYDYDVAAGGRRRPREPLRRRDRPARAGGHRRHAARRLRERSQQHRAARRVRVDVDAAARPSCAAATASTTTSRRWRPRKGCTSARRTST